MRYTRESSPALVVQAAKILRGRQTPAERLLWGRLRGKRVGGFRFRRQHPIGPFVVDFFCDEVGLVVELDGGVHLVPEQAKRDAERAKSLEGLGLVVVRFSNELVEHEIDAVVQRIEWVAFERVAHFVKGAVGGALAGGGL